MSYEIVFAKEVEDDLRKLGHVITQKVFKKLIQIAENPILGEDLGNKANMDLTGYRRVYIDKKRVKIVYKIINEKLQVFVIAIGKRDDMNVYKTATLRSAEITDNKWCTSKLWKFYNGAIFNEHRHR